MGFLLRNDCNMWLFVTGLFHFMFSILIPVVQYLICSYVLIWRQMAGKWYPNRNKLRVGVAASLIKWE